MNLSETEIIEKIQSGDEDAFRGFVEMYKNKAYSLILKILKNPDEAEDCLQDAFIKLYRAIIQKSFEGKSKLSTYFYTIVYNTALDKYKRLKKTTFSMISIDVENSNFKDGDELGSNFRNELINPKVYEERHEINTEKKIAENEITVIINKYINDIPEQYSVILNMFFINELSHKEISDILKLPVGTVKNRIFRAKEKIKKLILENYSEDEILQYI